MILEVNLVTEFHDATLDWEKNIAQLWSGILKGGEKGNDVFEEVQHLSVKTGMPDSFVTHRGSGYRIIPTEKDAENYFSMYMFQNIIEFVIDGLSCCFSAVRDISGLFDFL